MTRRGHHPLVHRRSGSSVRPRPGLLLAGLAGGVGVLGVLASCGSTATSTPSTPGAPGTTVAESPGTTSGTTAGSGYALVPDAEVKAGLTEVRAMAAGVKTTLATDRARADADVRTMYDRWFEFEGTVRKNDKNLYLQMEDGLAAIKAGTEQNRPDKVDKGIKDLEEGASAYLVKFP